MKESTRHNVALVILYFNIALYATCFQLQRPIEPYMVEKLGLDGDDSDGEYAKLQSFFNVIHMIGSLIFGLLLDWWGPRGGFILSFAASGISYALLANATSLNMLYASKIPTVFQSGFLCAQAAAAELTTSNTELMFALGRLTMAYTVGSVLGPSIGGMLGASGDYYLSAKLAVFGSMVSILLVLVTPFDGHTSHSDSNDDTPHGTPNDTANDKINGRNGIVNGHAPGRTSWKVVVKVVRATWVLLATKIISSIANSMTAATMPLILKNTYNLNEQYMGFSMSVMSAFNALVNGVFLGPIVNYFDGDITRVISVCNVGMLMLYLVQLTLSYLASQHISLDPSIFDNFYYYFVVVLLLGMFQYVLATCITGESTRRVEKDEKGTLLGFEHSLYSAARVVTPHIGVSLLKWGGLSAVSGGCASVFLVVNASWFLLKGSYRKKKLADMKKKKG